MGNRPLIKTLSVVMSLVLLISFFSPFSMGAPSSDSWVDPLYNASTPGWGLTHFATIQSAVDLTPAGGTVHIASGTYLENVTINKTIYLSGENKETTIIDAGHTGSAIYVDHADEVTIDSLRLSNSRLDQQEYQLPALSADQCTGLLVEDCIIDDVGISLNECSTCSIHGNIIDAHVPVILHGGRENNITQNIMTARHPQGVGLYRSHGNQVMDNQITGWSEGPG